MSNPTGTGSMFGNTNNQGQNQPKTGDGAQAMNFFNTGATATGDKKPPTTQLTFGNNQTSTQNRRFIRGQLGWGCTAASDQLFRQKRWTYKKPTAIPHHLILAAMQVRMRKKTGRVY